MKTVIYMEPVGKARARTVRRKLKGGGEKVMSYTPQKTVDAEKVIQDAIVGLNTFFPKGVALRLTATFFRSRPIAMKKHVTLPVTRPDWDNYGKLLSDALNGLMVHDDGQISTAIIRKRYGDVPRIEFDLQVDWED